jgi:membrane protein HdeD
MQETSRGRSTADLLLGAGIVLVGLVILGHTVTATTISLLFLGWLLFASGVVTLAASLFLIGKEGFWTGALGGGLMTALGIVFLRHTSAAAVTVTLVAGAIFLTSGLARLVVGFQLAEGRIGILVSGLVSTVLGLLVLFNLLDASDALLGFILGIQVLAEGVAIMLVGRETLALGRSAHGTRRAMSM